MDMIAKISETKHGFEQRLCLISGNEVLAHENSKSSFSSTQREAEKFLASLNKQQIRLKYRMPKQVLIEATGIVCTIRKHARAKKITLSVKDGSRVLVTVPKWVSYRAGKKFASKHKDWISKKLAEGKKMTKKSIFEKGTIEDYKKNKEKARELVTRKIEKFNNHYGFKVGRIAIRNQRTRWGSCSEKRNLNFNWRIVLLNDKQVDYLVVHELCHLGQLNHSKKYWDLVAQTIPNYRLLAKQVRVL